MTRATKKKFERGDAVVIVPTSNYVDHPFDELMADARVGIVLATHDYIRIDVYVYRIYDVLVGLEKRNVHEDEVFESFEEADQAQVERFIHATELGIEIERHDLEDKMRDFDLV